MTATRTLVASLFRRGIRSGVVIALLIAVGVGAVLTSWTGARRSATAFHRANTAARSADVTVTPNVDLQAPALADFSGVARLPQVAHAGIVLGYLMASVRHGVPKPDLNYFAPAPTDATTLQTFNAPIIVRGRRADPANPHEIVVSENTHFTPGEVVPLALYRANDLAAKYQQLQREQREPNAADFAAIFRIFRFRVVGIVRSPNDALTGGDPTVVLTAAWAQGHRNDAMYMAVFATIKGTSSERAFAAAARARYPNVPLTIASRRDDDALFEAAEAPYVQALRLFAISVAITALLILGQAIARLVRTDATDLSIWRALGVSSRQAVAAASSRAVGVIVAGVGLGLIAAGIASRWFPLGLARRVEPHPGIAWDVVALEIGAVVATAALVICALASAIAAVRRASRTNNVQPHRTYSFFASLPPAITLGLRRAFAPRRGRAGTTFTAVTGLVVAGATVAMALVFGAGLDQLVTVPAESGWTWDRIYDTFDGTISPTAARTIAHDDAVTAATIGTRANVTIGNFVLPVYALDARRGPIHALVRAGRLPERASEIALGGVTRRQAHAGLGGRVTIAGGDGVRRRLRVVGEVVLPPRLDLNAGQRLGQGGLLTPAGLRRIEPGSRPSFALIDLARPRPTNQTLVARWGGQGSIHHVGRSTQILSYDRVRRTPLILAALLAFLGLAVLAHALVSTLRTSRREFAVLRSIGFVRRQILLTVYTQATAMVIVAEGIGALIGIVAGRWLWRQFAEDLGVVAPPVVPVAVLLVCAAAAVVFANVVAAWTGWRALRVSAASALRAE